ncbi:MAG TPA: alanine dehydrogenase, partial [Chloroflexota bacterium]
MIVGTVREIKARETRVGLTPAGVQSLVGAGHRVLVEQGAGAPSGYPDEAYARQGAEIVDEAVEVWRRSDLVVKVKEPQIEEFRLLRPDLVLFTYLHLAASRDLTEALLRSGVTAVAYETVELPDGSTPLLAPMSEVAGRMAPLVAAHVLGHPTGGNGKLLCGVAGVPPAHVVV